MNPFDRIDIIANLIWQRRNNMTKGELLELLHQYSSCLLTREEAEQMLNMKPGFLKTKEMRRQIPRVKIRSAVRYTLQDICTYIEKHKEVLPPEPERGRRRAFRIMEGERDEDKC
jgi:hypothetical protein